MSALEVETVGSMASGFFAAASGKKVSRCNKEDNSMTMAPGQKKRGFLLELIFISILIFLLMGSRSQRTHTLMGQSGGNAINPGVGERAFQVK
jgi:hypothetical protein